MWKPSTLDALKQKVDNLKTASRETCIQVLKELVSYSSALQDTDDEMRSAAKFAVDELDKITTDMKNSKVPMDNQNLRDAFKSVFPASAAREYKQEQDKTPKNK